MALLDQIHFKRTAFPKHGIELSGGDKAEPKPETGLHTQSHTGDMIKKRRPIELKRPCNRR